MEFIKFKKKKYLKLQSEGFASQYAFPFANKLLKGIGIDCGYNKEEWALPSNENRKVILIDSNINSEYHALNLPKDQMVYDFIFSSHMLEHTDNWVEVLEYWWTRLKYGGILFLYLPHPAQEYWLPFNNRKHIHSLSPNIMRKYFKSGAWKDYIVTKGYDLNHSFYCVATKGYIKF